MIRFIFYCAVFIVSVWCGLIIMSDPGVASFSYHQWIVTMPLWVAALGGILFLLCLHFFISFFRIIGNINGCVHQWRRQYRTRKAIQQTRTGLVMLAEGKWQSAEKYLAKAAPYQVTPLINYLAAARAAQEQGADTRRDEYLKLAHQSTPDSAIAVGLTQAQLQMNHQQIEQSLATLRHLHESEPHHPHVLKLLKEIYCQLHDWQSLEALLPELKKRKALTPDELEDVTVQVYRGLLEQQAEQGKKLADTDEAVNQLNAIWKKIPRPLQKNKQLVIIYVENLLARHQDKAAETLLRELFKHQWDLDLVDLYGKITGEHPEKRLSYAESLLKKHGPSAPLLLTLGRLSLQNQLWGKALSYFTDSIKATPCPEAHTQLGLLQEFLKEPAQALYHYRYAALLQQPGITSPFLSKLQLN